MRKEELDRLVRQRPFVPFTVRLVDGRAYRFDSPEQLIVSRSTVYTLDKNNDGRHLNRVLVASAHAHHANGARKR